MISFLFLEAPAPHTCLHYLLHWCNVKTLTAILVIARLIVFLILGWCICNYIIQGWETQYGIHVLCQPQSVPPVSVTASLIFCIYLLPYEASVKIAIEVAFNSAETEADDVNHTVHAFVNTENRKQTGLADRRESHMHQCCGSHSTRLQVSVCQQVFILWR